MKTLITTALLILGMFSFISCERHSWEDSKDGKGTKQLYPKPEHGEHADQGKEEDSKKKHLKDRS